MLKKSFKKAAAIAMTAIFCTLPLTSTALAAQPGGGNKNAQPPRQEQRVEHNNRPAINNGAKNNQPPRNQPQLRKQPPRNQQPQHRQQPPKHRKKSFGSSGSNLVTGLIIGGVIGAVIANNT